MGYLRALWRLGIVASAAAVALLITEACSDAVSDALVDAGEMLADAGAKDGGGLMAEAGQLVLEAGMNIRDARTDVQAQVAAAFKSGSRIKMRMTIQQGSDGSQYGGYPTPFDTMLNVDCAPGIAADGKTRCLPKAIGIQSGWFSDAACTTALALDAYPCNANSAPLYGSLSVPGAGSTCATPTVTRIFALSAEHTGTAYAKSGASCTSIALPSGWKAYRPGAEVPPASLVEFTNAAPETL